MRSSVVESATGGPVNRACSHAPATNEWRGVSPGGDVITGGSLMHVQDSHWSSASALASGGMVSAATGNGRGDASRTTPLRVDAQRNLEHVLRAAREVF